MKKKKEGLEDFFCHEVLPGIGKNLTGVQDCFHIAQARNWLPYSLDRGLAEI